ncbi:hypothetical protein C8F04DRAFT_413054 [Mycena alexandri]|uniref:SET domain-containing protein n=1 Tax=Mycena alexandri TaxID=1745969 RepID=A0AAD6T2A5_9AGAR|nr:hypothetical protein C8F04DRAFT_413054 [Mycena alexandri]
MTKVPGVYSPPSLPGSLATILNFSYDTPGDPRSPLTPFKKRPTVAELTERLTPFFEAQNAPSLIPAAVQAADESWAAFGDRSVAPSDFFRPAPGAPYRVAEIPGKGRGMRASRDLQAGDVVVSESPLIVLVKDQLFALNFFALPKGAINALLLLHNRIPENFEFSLQQDSPQHRLLDYLKGVATTNAFEEPVQKGGERAGVIVLAGSLFNHSTKEPNVDRKFDVSSFKMTFTTTIPVKEGEELTVSYNRSAELLRSHYGIQGA